MKPHRKDMLTDLLSLLGYDGLAEDIQEGTITSKQQAQTHIVNNNDMIDNQEDQEAQNKAIELINQYL